jgi:tRNA-dihydrouridine synthase 1
VSSTLTLASNLQASGAAFIALHARHPSARRRRQGAADLSVVKALVEGVDIPVISNGNVRTWDDVLHNKDYTGASGVMVGESLLGNPYLFEGTIPDPVSVSLEYLELCRMYPDTATPKTIQTHIRHFMEHQCKRRPWFLQFCTKLGQCTSLDEIEALLRVKVRRWRGLTDLSVVQTEGKEAMDEDTGIRTQGVDLTGFLAEDELPDSYSMLELEM